jgi:hypothetical protein
MELYHNIAATMPSTGLMSRQTIDLNLASLILDSILTPIIITCGIFNNIFSILIMNRKD